MQNNFITNAPNSTNLKSRLKTLISGSDELKFLVGFFYFGGWSEIYEELQKKPEVRIKILVGLQVFNHLGNIIEYVDSNNRDKSTNEAFQEYLTSLHFALNNPELDSEAFYNQISFFVQMLQENRLKIRKTQHPNHAKLYLFKYNEKQAKFNDRLGEFITGSSNFTKAGLSGQEEFNVEIRDYGFLEASAYFDELWENAYPITDDEENRQLIIQTIQTKTQVADITPFEAYCLVIKAYLDLHNQNSEKVDLDELLKKVELKKFTYQTDAVSQAIQKINEHNGCIIADVVGLGKSVIASMIARQMNLRGIVICPPGLMGDAEKKDSGWWEYLEKFGLHNWQVFSRGILDRIADNIEGRNFDMVIVDEAHYFRNSDTADYENLKLICQNKKVILLSATPFNNSPKDILALLELFLISGKSSITLNDNLKGLFESYNYQFKQLSKIRKNWNTSDDTKRRSAEQDYVALTGGELPIDLKKVDKLTKKLSEKIRNTIDPVIIRRNRLDLLKDKVYSKEVGELSKVNDPVEGYYYLNEQQDEFYERIIKKYFSEKGVFSGAIYQPFIYQKIVNENKLDEAGNRKFNQQKNLYDFMRRILVKRFESSFGAFEKSIERFLEVHLLVRDFVKKTSKYILDRSLIQKINEFDLDGIEEVLLQFSQGSLERKTPKNTEVYEIDTFQRKTDFLNDIDRDIELFQTIQEELKVLKLVENDPKQSEIISIIKEQLTKEPNRKIILFSEYSDTIKHLEKGFREAFKNQVLVCDGKVNREFAKNLNEDFNAQYKGTQNNFFKILLTSDKLSEGFNLNRAGMIINYDIPWNPTRVIQRVGRINRIGTKVFDELYILNFFPSVKGSNIIKSREIAQQKMFLIHNALGEDAKIFDKDEKPQASMLMDKVNTYTEGEDQEHLITRIRNLYADLQEKYPEVFQKINQLPARVKTAKKHQQYELNVLKRKGNSLFVQHTNKDGNVVEISFEELLPKIECKIDEPTLKLSSVFWELYKEVNNHKPNIRKVRSEISLEEKAMANLKNARKIIPDLSIENIGFIEVLIKDLREYHTLANHTIRRIATIDFAKGKKAIDTFVEQVEWIKKHLGTDYLHNIDKQLLTKRKEIIIAIENNDQTELFN
ncbi:helicase-related protein [Capnocytophaga canis]|uniref:helicase-related protein n=1 Tax=Capnocytophaga canis TaxID=1848903 RepID=UPI001562B849|nr:helicase-related protein [Capnocytophaga canis]